MTRRAQRGALGRSGVFRGRSGLAGLNVFRGGGVFRAGSMLRGSLCAGLALLAIACIALIAKTRADLLPLPHTLAPSSSSEAARLRMLDRNGEALSATFTNDWNLHDRVALYETPPFLRAAFIAAEDKRFHEHGGVDWAARFAALAANIRHASAVRGASTITEQVVRMLHARPRTLWSRWLEGWEAARLERAFSKNEILEFYLNQVPYAANRRGVRQAASYYFNRDLGTLSRKEMLALAVLVRAPSRLDLRRSAEASEGAMARLADTLAEQAVISGPEVDAILSQPFDLEPMRLAVYAPHFLRRARAQAAIAVHGSGAVTTTLDGTLQTQIQAMLDERLADLGSHDVRHGAVLAADHLTGEVLAWVVGGGGRASGPATHFDTVTTPRQPGSALKPFLYALALDNGWTAAQIIVDAPLTESTSGGLHSYRNYSRRFYGPVSLRDALGNSLNIPAVKTLQYVGAESYIDTLHRLGFDGLSEHPDFYGDGIALGTGGVTLFELVQAYATLANQGVFRPLTTLLHDASRRASTRVFSAEAATLIGNVLADPDARALEFGRDSVLRFPVQTAVKTGTSSDFRDSWAVGFNHRYTVGVWIGNLDRTSSAGITGSTGPALVLRGVFSELTRDGRTRPLPLSPALTRHSVCLPIAGAGGVGTGGGTGAAVSTPDAAGCLEREEWFLPGTRPKPAAAKAAPGAPAANPRIRLRQPTDGLRLAFDPRLPADAQAFEFIVDGLTSTDRVDWIIDGRKVRSEGPRHLWPVTKGEHRVIASVWREGVPIAALGAVEFAVR